MDAKVEGKRGQGSVESQVEGQRELCRSDGADAYDSDIIGERYDEVQAAAREGAHAHVRTCESERDRKEGG